MTLLAEIGAAVRGAINVDVFPAATLHVVTEGEGSKGETTRSRVDYPAQGFVSSWDANTMAAKGYASNTAKVVLVQAADLPKPKLGDEVTATRPIIGTTETYRVTDVSSDPADATWSVAGVKI